MGLRGAADNNWMGFVGVHYASSSCAVVAIKRVKQDDESLGQAFLCFLIYFWTKTGVTMKKNNWAVSKSQSKHWSILLFHSSHLEKIETQMFPMVTWEYKLQTKHRRVVFMSHRGSGCVFVSIWRTWLHCWLSLEPTSDANTVFCPFSCWTRHCGHQLMNHLCTGSFRSFFHSKVVRKSSTLTIQPSRHLLSESHTGWEWLFKGADNHVLSFIKGI